MVFHHYIITLILDNQWFFFLFSGDIYLSLYISFFRYMYLLRSIWDFCNFIRGFTTNQITNCFCYFWIALFELVSSASVANCLVWSTSFWLYLPYFFTNVFAQIFSKRQKYIAFYKYLIFRFVFYSLPFFLFFTLINN